MGHPISIAIDQTWETPLGTSRIASKLAESIIAKGGARVAPEAFLHEHSIEVQLPFLQYLFGVDVPFVPICIMLPPLEALITLGEAIAAVARQSPGLVITSSDFTHYQPSDIAHKTDHEAIDRITSLDVEGFYRKLISERLTICGGGAIAALMSCARILGWVGKLVSYATSGDVTGDQSAVVGYAAISFIGGHDDK
jgi:AmmeMemoRadiSam system protein B